jgi:hypothetical protein
LSSASAIDHGQRSLVGHAHTAMPAAFDAHLPHQLVDAPAAAVNDNRLHSHQPQQRDVASETGHERRIGHRVSAEADDEYLPVVRVDVRKRFGQNTAFGIGGHCTTDSGSVRDYIEEEPALVGPLASDA